MSPRHHLSPLLFAGLLLVALLVGLARPNRTYSSGGGRLGHLTSSVVSIGPSTLPSGEANASYSTRLTASGGGAPYHFELFSGSLPTGLSMNASGLISGTPTLVGTTSFVVKATDADYFSGKSTITIAINPGPTIDTSSLGEATAASAYSINLVASGGTAPYSWSIATGPIPGGLILNSGGTLSGIPGSAGTYEVDLEVTDAVGSSASATLSLTVLPKPPPVQQVAVLNSTGVEAYLNGAPVGAVSGTAGEIATALSPTGNGGWAVNSDGRVVGFGGEHTYGSVGTGHLAGRIVSIAVPPTGGGYWLASSKGYVYGFGDAKSKGSLAHRRYRGHLIAITASPVGDGYWLLTSTGRVYAFGGAHNYGSVNIAHRVGHLVGLTPGPRGYWIAMSTGVVFGKGPSCKNVIRHHASPVVGLASAPNGVGFWLLSRDGAVTAVGSARGFVALTQPDVPGRGIAAAG